MKSQGYDYSNIKVFEKSMINGLTKKLSSFRFGSFRNPDGKHCNERVWDYVTNIGMDLANDIYEYNADLYMFKKTRKITVEQTKFGKQWLKNHFFKTNGEPRSGKATENVGSKVLNIAKNVSKFEFIGVLGCKNAFGDYVQFLPVYRTYNRKGEYFDYAPVHWGQPVIMEGN